MPPSRRSTVAFAALVAVTASALGAAEPVGESEVTEVAADGRPLRPFVATGVPEHHDPASTPSLPPSAPPRDVDGSRSDWEDVFDDVASPPPPDRPPPVITHRPHPAQDLFVSEPYYGDVPAPVALLAFAVLGFDPPPIHLETEEARHHVRAARRRLETVLALTDADFEPESLVAAAERLGLVTPTDDPTDPWQQAQALALDFRALQAATTEELRPTLATLGVDVPDGTDGAGLRRAVREALAEVGAPLGDDESIGLDDLRWLAARANLVRAGATLSIATQEVLGPRLTLTQYAGRHDDDLPLRVHVVTFDPAAVPVTTAPTTAFGRRTDVLSAVRAAGARVAVNGGFWVDGGDPDGLLVTRGRLLSDPTAGDSWVRSIRSGFGVRADGSAVVGRPTWDAWLDGRQVTGIGRAAGPTDLVLYTPGQRVPAARDGVQVTFDAPTHLQRDGRHDLTVRNVDGATGGVVPPNGLVAVARGSFAVELARRAEDGVLSLVIDVGDGWEDLTAGLAGGPLLLADGASTGLPAWRSEGFAGSHTDLRHPRTMVGFDDQGVGYLVVVDGRRPGWSVGVTQAEAIELALSLGLTDAVQLDGGGSSTLVIDGRVVNRPCCDAALRSVATMVTLG